MRLAIIVTASIEVKYIFFKRTLDVLLINVIAVDERTERRLVCYIDQRTKTVLCQAGDAHSPIY